MRKLYLLALAAQKAVGNTSKAIEFLRGGMAVQDIAKRLGYRSPQYFIRIFKENYGTTPYQYKKTVLDTEER